MSEHSNAKGQLTVGLDVGDRYVHACLLDSDGEILEGTRMATNARSQAFSSPLALWVTGEVYEPLRNASLRGELFTT